MQDNMVPSAKVDTPTLQSSSENNLASLKQYSRLKLELASITRSVMQSARARNDRVQEAQCHKLMARLVEDRFNLAVVGQFNRGKTSLMNALLGSNKLPTGILPLTSVVTAVCYGDHEQALIRFKNSYLHQTISLEELPLFVTEIGNPGNTKQVALAEVHLPANLLRLGLFFTDTPGIGSAISANTATTRSFLPEIDAAIFVTSFEAPLSEGELTFFDEVRSHVRQIFVVVNKADLVTPQEREQVVAFVRDKLAQRSGLSELPVFAVSARMGLAARLTGGTEIVQSGLLNLEGKLATFLRTQKATVLLTRVSEALETLLKTQSAALEAAARATAHPDQLALAQQALRAKVEQLRREHERILAPLGASLGCELANRFDTDLEVWRKQVRTDLLSQATKFLKSADVLTLLAGAPEISAALTAACQEQTRAWFTEHAQELQRVIYEYVADYAVVLDRTADEAFRFDEASALSVSSGWIQPESTKEIFDRVPLVFPQPPSFQWHFALRWWIYALPLRAVKHYVLDQCSSTLKEALLAHTDEMRLCLQLLASEWVDRLRLKLDESLNASIARVETILKAKPEATEQADINGLLVKLKELQNGIASLNDEIGSEADSMSELLVEEYPGTNALGPCVICSRLEDELFQFMSNRQYDLSVSESEQLGHAERGGFCPLHTWHYEGMASAQGICTAYPPVLLSLSRRLQFLAQEIASSGSAADNVTQLLSDARTCAACELTSAVEQRVANELVASLSSGNGQTNKVLPALCVPHLSTLLNVVADKSLARQLIQEQSRVIERLAEDMQRYALKHDAVRRDLATEGEWRAHMRALSRLVGSRNLAQSRKTPTR